MYLVRQHPAEAGRTMLGMGRWFCAHSEVFEALPMTYSGDLAVEPLGFGRRLDT